MHCAVGLSSLLSRPSTSSSSSRKNYHVGHCGPQNRNQSSLLLRNIRRFSQTLFLSFYSISLLRDVDVAPRHQVEALRLQPTGLAGAKVKRLFAARSGRRAGARQRPAAVTREPVDLPARQGVADETSKVETETSTETEATSSRSSGFTEQRAGAGGAGSASSLSRSKNSKFLNGGDTNGNTNEGSFCSCKACAIVSAVMGGVVVLGGLVLLGVWFFCSDSESWTFCNQKEEDLHSSTPESQLPGGAAPDGAEEAHSAEDVDEAHFFEAKKSKISAVSGQDGKLRQRGPTTTDTGASSKMDNNYTGSKTKKSVKDSKSKTTPSTSLSRADKKEIKAKAKALAAEDEERKQAEENFEYNDAIDKVDKKTGYRVLQGQAAAGGITYDMESQLRGSTQSQD